MGISDKDFVRYRFALIQMPDIKQPPYLEDGIRPVLYYLASGSLTRFHRGHDLRAPIHLRRRSWLRPR